MLLTNPTKVNKDEKGVLITPAEIEKEYVSLATGTITANTNKTENILNPASYDYIRIIVSTALGSSVLNYSINHKGQNGKVYRYWRCSLTVI